MHLPKTPIKYFRGDPWTIVEEGFNPAYQRVSQISLFFGQRVHGRTRLF